MHDTEPPRVEGNFFIGMLTALMMEVYVIIMWDIGSLLWEQWYGGSVSV